MTPTFATFDAADGGLPYTIVMGNGFLGTGVQPNGLYLVLSELGQSMSLARLVSSMTQLVRIVFSAGCPTKIGCSTIGTISVIVSALCAKWRRPEEGSCNKQMHVKRFVNAVNRQIYAKVSAFFVFEAHANTSRNAPHSPIVGRAHSGLTSHPTKIAYREKLFKANNRFPNFVHDGDHAMSMQQSQHLGYETANNRLVAA